VRVSSWCLVGGRPFKGERLKTLFIDTKQRILPTSFGMTLTTAASRFTTAFHDAVIVGELKYASGMFEGALLLFDGETLDSRFFLTRMRVLAMRPISGLNVDNEKLHS